MKLTKSVLAKLFFLFMATATSQCFADDAPTRDSMTLTEFVNQSLVFGVAQMELAKLALQKSTAPEVKKFAQLIIDERITANNDVTNIANKKHIKVISDSDLLTKARGLIPKPNNQESFDGAYIKNQIKARQDELELFNKGALSQDPELAGFATENIPRLTHNLHLAETLAKDFNQQ